MVISIQKVFAIKLSLPSSIVREGYQPIPLETVLVYGVRLYHSSGKEYSVVDAYFMVPVSIIPASSPLYSCVKIH